MSEKKLTQKQAAFVSEYMKDFNATQAAIRAGYSQKTAGAIGDENLKKPEIAAALAELQKKAQERNEVTVDDIIRELDENRRVALAAPIPQSSAATAATLGKAKILGMLVDKVVGAGKNGEHLVDSKQTIDTTNLTEDQLRAIAGIKINGG